MGTALNIIYCIILKKSTQLTAFISQRLRLRRQPSLVRKLGPLLFWIEAQRIYLVWKEDATESCSSYSDDSESTLSSYQWPETSAVTDSKDSDQMGAKIEEMQKEITQLQAQLSQIILKIAGDEGNSFSDKGYVPESSSTSLPSAEIVRPAPPPPPLPPQSPSPWTSKLSVIVKVRTGDESHADKTDNKTCSIVEELATKPPKLRHVERSPGGRPIRSTPNCTATSNSDILTAVLKKRFEAMHSP